MSGDRLDAGLDTARLTASEQDRLAREEREADALAYLTRTNNLDVAEILGLIESPKPKRQPRSARAAKSRKES